MTQRSIAFVHSWIDEHVRAESLLDERKIADPKVFAAWCRKDAQTLGISREEIDEDFDSLEDLMAEAIEAAADRC
jgi:hypothetical protein